MLDCPTRALDVCVCVCVCVCVHACVSVSVSVSERGADACFTFSAVP